MRISGLYFRKTSSRVIDLFTLTKVTEDQEVPKKWNVRKSSWCRCGLNNNIKNIDVTRRESLKGRLNVTRMLSVHDRADKFRFISAIGAFLCRSIGSSGGSKVGHTTHICSAHSDSGK